MSDQNVLQMKNIIKEFDGVRVLENVNFDLKKGEVHALVGANGAGKSTLMRILNGILINYEGEIVLNKEKTNYQSPNEAYDHGIAMIHQELDLVNNLDVSENIYLGRELKTKGGLSRIDRKTMRKNVQDLLDSLNFPIKATDIVGKLPPAKQQLVLIARVVNLKSKVVVMDEPTSSLSINEIEKLFGVIKDLCKKGISVIYISHFLEEIFRIADRVTVLRDGVKVVTKDINECNKQQLVKWMVGHEANVGKNYIRKGCLEKNILSVRGLTQKTGIVKDVNFDLKKGEVLGIAGVVGSGRTELVKMIYGAEKIGAGSIELEGKNFNIKKPSKAVANRIAFIPENRKKEGLVLNATINQNVALTGLKSNSRFGFINYSKVYKIIKEVVTYLKVKYTSQNQEARYLSGGNQQKIVIAKWLSIDSKIIIMDQPTRGVDVGAKEEIYDLINNLAKKGTTIILISDEMEEILNLSDRILVMKRGEIVCEFDNCERVLNKVDLLTSMVSDEDTQGKVVI